MKIWVGVTDEDWFAHLSHLKPDEVNFWQPSGGRAFRALAPGEPFLFKLHSPNNFIVGGGFFVSHTPLPASLAWDAFGIKNGVGSLEELHARIRRYRRDTEAVDPVIGCTVLAEPFFLNESAWLPVPNSWAPNIVQGKTYDTDFSEGRMLWESVQLRMAGLRVTEPGLAADAADKPRFGSEFLARSRL